MEDMARLGVSPGLGWSSAHLPLKIQIQIHGREIAFEHLSGKDLRLTILERYTNCRTDAVVWDAGLVLANYLWYNICECDGTLGDSEKTPFAGARVLELGSGTGLVGILAGALGAKKVVLTDLPHAVPMLRKNVEKNWEEVEKYRRSMNCSSGSSDFSSVFHAVDLTWGDADDLKKLTLENCNFEYILMADCVFDPEVTVSLVKTLQDLVQNGVSTSKGGCPTILCANEKRECDKNARSEKLFRELLASHRFALERVENDEMHPEFQSDDIEVHRILYQGGL